MRSNDVKECFIRANAVEARLVAGVVVGMFVDDSVAVPQASRAWRDCSFGEFIDDAEKRRQ